MKSINLSTEPAIIIGLIGGAIIAVLQAIEPQIGSDLSEPLIQIAQAVIAVITILGIRLKVWSPASVAKLEGGDGPTEES